jgi:hypothetical protein
MTYRYEVSYEDCDKHECYVSVYPNGSKRVISIQRFIDKTRLELIEFFDSSGWLQWYNENFIK